jgi:hypothetical protein
MRPGDNWKKISEEGEAEYLDKGGMTIERRDYYFTRAMTALKAAEELMASRDHAICWMTTCENCADMWDKNYEMYCQMETLKAAAEGKAWPPPPTPDDDCFA